MITPLSLLKYPGSIFNNIKGELNKCDVNIYDVLFPKTVVWLVLHDTGWHYTVIDIKEKTINR